MAKVLIVEDEESILVGLKDNFELEGYEVDVARDGEEALVRAAEFLPDLVLLDLMLPKKNGFEVCRSLRHSLPGTFIIMLTAKTDESSKVAGLEIGADGCHGFADGTGTNMEGWISRAIRWYESL